MLQAREKIPYYSPVPILHAEAEGWTVPEINSHHTQSHIHRLSLEQNDFMMMYGSSAGLLDRVSVLKSRAKASISVSHQCRYIYMYFCFITSRSGKEASGAYDHLGELDQALFMYLDHGSSHGHGGTQQEQRRKCVRMHMHFVVL
jgi:hypothetical protein